jgi:hypothetical protein
MHIAASHLAQSLPVQGKDHGSMIDWYERQIPHFVEDELNRLYGTLYSSMTWLRHVGIPDDVHTYVARHQGEISTVLLCQVKRGRVNVLTEGAELSATELRRFTDFVFARFGRSTIIIFNAVATDLKSIAHFKQNWRFSEDIIATLPGDAEAYFGMLGSATRKNVKRHANRLQRDFPSLAIQFLPGNQVSDDDLLEIIRFNHARLGNKNIVSYIDKKESEQILRLARECGFILTVRIDGKIRAGAITFRFGNHFVSRVNAHDPAYDDYRLGITCCVSAICEAIKLGGTHFHFMWGQLAYKTALLGVQQDQHRVLIYGSRIAVVRHFQLVTQTAFRVAQFNAKQWLLAKQKEDSLPARAIGFSVKMLKRLKWMLKHRRLRTDAPVPQAGSAAEL